ncbi:MAG: tRNA (guanosine(46)-N7)-methyltransferase TrmB [Bacteroidales bacterium]|nr:tRNA (guanosine(46)-N7)-methyltransferase TrmB [Bacteroidales bacterium]
MGHDKLRKFRENLGFSCLIQPEADSLIVKGEEGLVLNDHPLKGRWNGEVFQSARPLVLELGCGKGEYTIDLSRRMPDRNYIGVDIKGARLWKGAKFATENALPNVAFLRTRIEFIPAFFAPSEVSGIWLTFPDPQMKSENCRLTSPVFLERYRGFLKRGGVINLKTDSVFLYQYTLSVCRANSLKVLVSSPDLYGEKERVLEEMGSMGMDMEEAEALFEVRTFYEKMFLRQGYKITYIAFRPDHEGSFAYPEDFDAAYWRVVDPKRKLDFQG